MDERISRLYLLRIMANLLREDEHGPAELAYKAATKLVKLAQGAMDLHSGRSTVDFEMLADLLPAQREAVRVLGRCRGH